MTKFSSLLVAVLVLGFAGPALAADFTNAEFSGNVNVEGKAGTSKQVTLRVIVEDGEVVEYIETDVLGDGLAPVCHNISDLDEGTHNVNVSIKLPPNVDYYDLQASSFGIFGNFTSNGCDDDNQNGSETWNDVIRVTSSNGSSSDDADEESELSALKSLIASLQAQIAALLAKPVVECPPSTASVGVSGLQAWLVAKGYMTAAQVATGPGIYGPKTTAANLAATAACAR
jgi:hypothetical protein